MVELTVTGTDDRDTVGQVVAVRVMPEPAGSCLHGIVEATRELAGEGAEVESRINERAYQRAHERAQM